MTENKKIHVLLANTSLFNALPLAEIKYIALGSRVLKMDRSEILFHSGETLVGSISLYMDK
jgi:hypothetical protein